MTTQIQRRRGTTAQHGTFTGAVAELTVDTTKDTVVVHDGAQVGGYPLLREDGSNSALALGSAASPSLKFTGDPNTGLYSPGADQVAISTNGVGRLFVDASGNVAVNSPDTTTGAIFQITGGATSTSPDAAGRGAVLQLRNSNSTDSNSSAILFFSSNSQTTSYFSGVTTSHANRSGALVFGTSNAAAPTERMRLTSAGLLGLGTSSPDALLTLRSIAGGAPTYRGDIVLNQSGATGGLSANGGIEFKIDGSFSGFGARLLQAFNGSNSYNFAIQTRSNSADWSTRMLIDMFGNVGIGTTAPVTGFEVANGNITVSGADRSLVNRSNNALSLGTNNLTRLHITNTGNVGIGTTSPATTLDVNGDVTITDKIIHGGDTNTAIRFPAADTVSVETAGSERARIDSSGRLLVGTSSTTSASRAVFQGNSTSEVGVIRIATSLSTPGDGVALGQILFTDSSHFSAATITALRDGGTWTSESSQPTRLVFSTTADGAATPTERMRITNGGFLKFSNSGTYLSAGAAYHELRNNNITAPSVVVENTSSTTTTDGLLQVRAARDTSDNSYYVFGYYNAAVGAYRFRIADSGDATNTNNSYGAISDIKLKENIVNANSQWDDLKALQVRNYNFKEGQTHTQIGLIAQETELVSPGLVSESPDRDEDGNDLGTVTKSVNYSVLYMKAVKALQEAMERIEQLESSNADLLARVTALEVS
jgi:hypothetical protein